MEVICLLTNDDEMISITATINDTPVNKGGIWQLKNGTELHMWMVSELHMYAEVRLRTTPPNKKSSSSPHNFTSLYFGQIFFCLNKFNFKFLGLRNFSNLIQKR